MKRVIKSNKHILFAPYSKKTTIKVEDPYAWLAAEMERSCLIKQ